MPFEWEGTLEFFFLGKYLADISKTVLAIHVVPCLGTSARNKSGSFLVLFSRDLPQKLRH